MLSTLLCASFFLPLIEGPSDGGAWPGWRGPGGAGVGSGSPPVEWSEETNVRWKTPLPGKGLSCPVVWGDQVFVTTAVAVGEPVASEAAEAQGPGARGARGGRGPAPVEHDFLVLALSRSSGEVQWEALATSLTPHQGIHRDSSYATPTPVTDGELVIASFGSAGIFAYDLDGELVWSTDLGDMDIMRSFGEGASPVLAGEFLIVPWDNNAESFLVALDKSTGEELWRTERERSTSWCTPLVLEQDGRGLVVLSGARTVAYALRTGRELWSHGEAGSRAGGSSEGRGDRGRGGPGGGPSGGPGGAAGQGAAGRGRSGGGSGVISSPVFHDGLLLFSTGSRGGEFRALSLGADEAREASSRKLVSQPLLWSSEGDTPHVPSPLAYDGVFYSLKANSGMLSAFDAHSGERLYGPERLDAVANIYASPVAADGRIYLVDRDGVCEVLRAGAELETLAVNELEDAFDASPALAGDELFLRGREHLYCIAAD